ncbi:MAG: hypothetical protein E7448_00195 [Ruminococcaceae bacterium]|nr:hypothetical protein [Oscillospiraceae bacterium]
MKKATRILAFTLVLVMLLPFVPFVDAAQEYNATANYETVSAPFGAWKAGSNTVYGLTDILPKDTIVEGDASYPYYKNSTTNNAYGAAINGPYKNSGQGFNVGNGVKLSKGFGTHPKSNQAPADIIIDISAYTDPNGQYKVDTFYSVVGLTNTASKGVYFQVYVDKGDGNYQLVANSEAITGKTLGEFNVDIKGVKNLKLTVITSTDDHSSSAAAWMSPSIFTADASAKKPSAPSGGDQPSGPSMDGDTELPSEFKPTDNYSTVTSTETNAEGIPYGPWMAGSNELQLIPNIIPKESVVMPDGDKITYRYYQYSTTNNAYGAAINGPYKKSDQNFSIGNGFKYNRGFGTHPKAKQAPVDIILDISAYTDPNGTFKCDTFYSVVALTDVASKGVYFLVYGDYGDGNYKLLGTSEEIKGKNVGEFNIDVKGVKNLKLTVVSSTSDNSASACAWVYPCLFTADSAATKPATPVVPEFDTNDGSTKYPATDDFAEVVWADNNRDTRPFGAWMAGSNPVISLVDTIPGELLAQTTGLSPNYEYYTKSTTLNEFGVSINGPFKKSGAGFTVGTNVPFTVGFGTHPKANQQQTYIDLDIAQYTDPNGQYACDTFYSCVALTNTASAGVYFQVFADYGDGVFKHIANSTAIIKANIGEFNVNVTGVKTLRLVVISATMSHGSSASAWLDPSLFKADPNAVKPDFSNYDPSIEFEKEPVKDAPLFVWPEGVERPIKKEEPAKEVPVGLIIGIAAGVIVIAGGACAAIIIIRKKKK